MKRFHLVRLLLVLTCLAALLTGCSRDPNVRKQKYLESGQRYFDEGKYREAIIQYRNATQVDGRFADAHYQLAQAYLKVKDWQHAYTELSRTVELEPENYKAHVDLANLLSADGEVKAAQEHVDLLLQKQPGDPATHIAAANILGREQRIDEAIAETRKAIALAPDRGDSYLNLALLQTMANLPDAAEPNYKKAIDLKATGANPRLALAAFYQARRRYAEAEQQVQQVIAENPKDPDPRIELSKLYIAQGKQAEAEQYMKQVKRDLPDDPAAYVLLGDYYFLIGDLDRAVSEYESLYNDHPKDLHVKKNYIQLLILKNRTDDANKLNEQILSSKAQDDEALVYRGEIQIHQGKLNEAVQTLQSVVSREPGMAVGHYQLGIAFSQLGDLDHAGTEWQEAVHLRPDMVDAYRSLATLALQKADMAGLERSASEMIRLQPAAADGYAMRSFSLMARKQFPAAEQDARKAIEIAPQAGVGYLEMGHLNALQQRFSEAENWYKQSLSRDANSGDALRGLLNLYVAQKQTDKAIATANAQIAISPNNSTFYDLLGSLLLGKKDYKGAEPALRKAIELDKHNSDAIAKLGSVQSAEGTPDAALATYNSGLKDNPKQAEIYILIGGVYENKHDLENAKSAYQTALQIKRDDPVASNNLAYLLLQTGGNADLALHLAQTARRGLPQLSNVADTLGWAFYQKSVYESAIEMFQEAIKLAAKNKEPDSALYHYHLGLAYAKAEKPALAKQHLERVLKIDPKYPDADDVKKELAQLKS
jgi:tetratricopeptide (TPR) repeat protein